MWIPFICWKEEMMMEKKQFPKLDLDYYVETLNSGLQVYVVPMKNVNGVYATFSTKYGSNDNEFVPYGKEKLEAFPDGIAHFLEHKVFEQEDESNPFDFFGARGAFVNANTNYYKTTYLFEGTDFLEDNLNYLIDFVQAPYFTDENVDKEQGIIAQEIKMYQDNPYTKLYEQCIYNAFQKHPIKYRVIGSIDSIRQITKDDLYTCYQTFYHPSNMMLVVTGNVDPNSVFQIVHSNQMNKSYENRKPVIRKIYHEPDSVYKEYEILEMPVMIPKVMMGFKFSVKDVKNIDMRSIIHYISLLFDIKLGLTSEFAEQIKKQQVVNDSIGLDYIQTDSHVLFLVAADTNFPDRFVNMVLEQFKNINITEEEFERKKKLMISSLIFMSDDIHRMNHQITNDLVLYDNVDDQMYEHVRKLNMKKFEKIIESITFDNYTTVVIEGKKH